MNLVGWIGAGLGALMIGFAVDRLHVTMSVAISSTAVIYVAIAAILYVTAMVTAPDDIRATRWATSNEVPPSTPAASA